MSSCCLYSKICMRGIPTMNHIHWKPSSTSWESLYHHLTMPSQQEEQGGLSLSLLKIHHINRDIGQIGWMGGTSETRHTRRTRWTVVHTSKELCNNYWNNKVTVRTIFGEQGWSSGESTRLAATNVAQVQTLMLIPYTAIIFEKGWPKKMSTWQSQKVVWNMINTLFVTLELSNLLLVAFL